MNTSFSEISARYERDSLIQKSAAERLLSLLAVSPREAVLDVGCGTGSLTRRIRALSAGRVGGVDASEAMINEARALSAGLDIGFEVGGAEEIAFEQEFDAVACNSALQWFRDPALALRRCQAALRGGGRMAVQAPATADFCPNFTRAIALVARDARTAEVWRHFKSPWLCLETAGDYRRLFEAAGLTVPFATIEALVTRHSPAEVMTVFESGAAAGYLNEACYGVPLTDAWRAAFRATLKGAFEAQAGVGGEVELLFHRVYLLAARPRA